MIQRFKNWYISLIPTPIGQDELLRYEQLIGLTRLRRKAKKNGKYWYSLTPEHLYHEIHTGKTKYKISYWVNYGDYYGSNGTYGWFTVEQIKQWLSTPDLKLSEIKKI